RSSTEIVSPGNHRPSGGWRLAIRNQYHSGNGHVFSVSRPRVIKNPPRRQFKWKVVLVGRFRAYQGSRLARGQRMWRGIKVRQRKSMDRLRSFGWRYSLSDCTVWISRQPDQNQYNYGQTCEKHPDMAAFY